MILLALDLETVPDVAAARTLDYEGTDEEVAVQMVAARLEATKGSSDFLAPGWHRIVAVGVAGLDTAKGTVRIGARCEPEEEPLILFAHLALLRQPRVLTYNGNAFDLPVLRYRALIHGIPLPSLYGPEGAKPWEQYQNRYGERHIDLADVLSGYGAAPRMKLAELAPLCGLGGKWMTGAEVWPLWLAGQYETIRRYVEHDAVTTLRLGIRFEMSRGRLTEGDGRRLVAALDEATAGVAV